MNMRHAGMGFPNGAVDLARVFGLPSSDVLMLVTEARWHHDAAAAAGKRVLWRAIPNHGRRPAEVGWSPSRFAVEALNQIATATRPIAGFVWANELDLQDERGDRQDDFSGLEDRYALIGGFADALLDILRSDLIPGTLIHFPAFTPDHDALGYVNRWGDAARRYDCIDFHAYDSLYAIQTRYATHREVFPDKRLALTEWHCRGDVDEERRVLQWLADTMASDPLFDAAYRFIWRWHNPSPWWDASFDVETRADMVAMFMDPPTATPGHAAESGDPPADQPPLTAPEPVSPHQEDTVPEMTPGIDISNNNGHIDWDAVAAAGIQWGYAKVSEGAGYVDRFFAENWAAMKARSMVRGGYHFARPSQSGADTEAQHFLDCLERAGGLEVGDFVVLDLEDEQASPSDDIGGWALTWLRYVEERVGFRPLVYTGKWYIDQYSLAGYPALGGYGLILAAYQSAMPNAPPPWGMLSAWQDRDHTGVPGVTGDHDWFNGSLATLRLYGKPPGPAVPFPLDPVPLPPLPDDKQATIDGLRVAIADMSDRIGDRIRTATTELGRPTVRAAKRHQLVGELQSAMQEMADTRTQFVGERLR